MIIKCTKCGRVIDPAVSIIVKEYMQCAHCKNWEDYSEPTEVLDHDTTMTSTHANNQQDRSLKILKIFLLSMMGAIALGLFIYTKSLGYYNYTKPYENPRENGKKSNYVTSENVKLWIAQDNIIQITRAFNIASIGDLEKKSLIIDAVFDSKYKKGMDYFMDNLWSNPHGYFESYTLQNCFNHDIPMPLLDILMLYISSDESDDISRMNKKQLLDNLNNAPVGEMKQVFMSYMHILVDTTSTMSTMSFTRESQLNWFKSYQENNSTGYDYLFPVLENVKTITYADVQPLVKYCVEQGNQMAALDLMAHVQNCPSGYPEIAALAKENQKLESTIIDQKGERKKLEDELKKYEECQTIYGRVIRLLDNNGFLDTPRYIVKVGYEYAILSTILTTFSSPGRFSMDVELLPEKIVLTDENGFTQYWPEYRESNSCEREKVVELRSVIKKKTTIINKNIKKTQEIAGKIDSFFDSKI